MASTSFEMDDQSDTEFFDKLVDDDDYQFSKPGNADNDDRFKGISGDMGQAESKLDSVSTGNTIDALSKLILDETEDNSLVSEEISGSDEFSPAESGLNENDTQVKVCDKGEDTSSADGNLAGKEELYFLDTSKEQLLTESAEISIENVLYSSDRNEEVRLPFNDSNYGNLKIVYSVDSKPEQSFDKTGSKNVCTSVREVQWSNFSATSMGSDVGGFGSYSDFDAAFPGGSTGNAGDSGEDFFSSLTLVEDDSYPPGQHISDPTYYQAFHVSDKGKLDAFGVSGIQPEVTDISATEQYNGLVIDANNQLQKTSLEGHSSNVVSPDQSYSTKDAQNAYSNQSWENAYPGWRYDYRTEQWIQLEVNEKMVIGSTIEGTEDKDGGSQYNQDKDGGSQYNLQSSESSISYSNWQTPTSEVYHGQSVEAPVDHVESLKTDASSGWVQGSAEQAAHNWQEYSQNAHENQQNVYYDPQYPGWYYDLVAQEWREITNHGQADKDQTSHVSEAFDVPTLSSQQASLSEQTKKENGVQNSGYVDNDNSFYSQNNQFQGFQTESTPFLTQWSGSSNEYAMSNGQWENSPSQENRYDGNQASRGVALNDNLTEDKLTNTHIGTKSPVYNRFANLQGRSDQAANSHIQNSTFFHNQTNNGFSIHKNSVSLQNSNSGQNLYSYNIQQIDQNIGSEVSHDFYGNLQPSNYSHQMYQPRQRANYTPPLIKSSMEGRSSEGRPPHALVAFGFGGKIVVLNPKNNLNVDPSYGSQDNAGGVITVHSISQLVMDISVSGSGGITNSYFHTLCRQAFSSPLVGGSVASKEIFKWIDERIANCESATSNLGNPEILCMLLCSLKIICQHYGKLRSTFGSTGVSQESDGPEAALTKLFSSAKSSLYGLNQFGAGAPCLQTVPSETQLQSTALEMENLLVAGKRKEALLLAQQGQLWGPAIVLAWQLGEKFYVDTVKLMAQQQFLPGSPLRTLCLLLAGQASEVFSTSNSTLSSTYSGIASRLQQSDQDFMNGMLNFWQENLAIIVANRTKGDERVIMHLGDCLWKERSEVAAAHICYLVAEANFEYFSDSARLCLVGADHWKYPRTYASPEAIQRTELYEYAKLLGNPQYILLPFQPYKLVYAHMLAEVGKISDAMKYCQAVVKILKNAGRAPEVEACRQLASSLEDRIRIRTQGGYGSNLAPSKLVGRFFSTIDRSIHRIIGGPPPVAPDSNSSSQNGESDSYSRVSEVKDVMPRSGATSLIPSASMEPISEWTGNTSKVTMQTRSVSEPNFIRSPQENQSKALNNATASSGQSRFGRFGVQILQKAVGFIAKSHHNEAKLGEKNKFYYDEELKRWVEEGAAPPPEEAPLSAPPTTAAFISKSQSMESGYSIGNALTGQTTIPNGGSENRSPSSQLASGIPPVPPSMNQFSARSRLQGVRSRYVDTFNKSGGTTISKSFQPPVIPAPRPGELPPAANFFVPTPEASDSNFNGATDFSEENSLVAACAPTENVPNGPTDVYPESSVSEDKFPKGAGSIRRFSSADNIRSMTHSSHSRTASGSGEYLNAFKNSEEHEAQKTPDRNQFSSVSSVSGYFSSPSNLDARKLGSGGYVYSTLPSPPPLEPVNSSAVIKKSVAGRGSTERLYDKIDHGPQTGFQADGFADLQEVEL